MESLYPCWVIFLWTTWCLFAGGSTGQSLPNTSGLPLAIRVPLRQGAQSDPLAPPAGARERTPGRAARRRRGVTGINFVDMIDNLRGKSGQGYYVEMAVGSPPQKVNLSLSLSLGQSYTH